MSVLVRLAPEAVFARDFRVVRPLAEGGMGAVYVVEQLSTGKTRALKIMQPALVVDARSRERFAHEARVGARIQSMHVVEVVGAGVDDATGTPWLAMEYLEGEGLDAVVRRRGALPPGEVLEIYEQACHALGAAHAAGVVHCDLKPENLLVARSFQRGVPFVVKVLDFGIARLLLENRTAATVTTAIGSPLWMAPEQGQKGARVRAETDVWALGLVAFHLLTGRSYWRAANVPADDFNVLHQLVEVASGPLDPPSARARELGCAAPPDGFDAWFARCVNRDLGARFPDAAAALAALRPVLSTASAPPELAPPRPVAPTVAAPAPEAPVPPPPRVTPETVLMTQAVAGLAGSGVPRPPVVHTEQVPTSRTVPTAPRRGGYARAAVAVVVVAGAVLAVRAIEDAPPEPTTRPTPDAPSPAVTAPEEPPEVVAPPPEPLGAAVARSNPWIRLQELGIEMQTHEVSRAEFWRWRPDLAGAAADGSAPAAGVSWYDASAFCAAISDDGRLPTRGEWVAALGTAPRRRGSWIQRVALRHGAVGSNPDDVALTGVRDLVGSVREWVSDAMEGVQHRCMGAAATDLDDEKVDRVAVGDVSPGPDANIGFRCVRAAR